MQGKPGHPGSSAVRDAAKNPPRPPVQGLGLRNPLLLVPTSVVQKGRKPRTRPSQNRPRTKADAQSWSPVPRETQPVRGLPASVSRGFGIIIMPPRHSTEGCYAAIFPGRSWVPGRYTLREALCAVLYVPDFCRSDNQYASRGADGLVAWPASREAKVRHSLHRTSLAILPFPSLQVPWLPSSEWCRWGCGGRTRSGTARRRLAPGWRTGAGGGRRWN